MENVIYIFFSARTNAWFDLENFYIFPYLVFIQLEFNSVRVIEVSDATHNSNEYSWIFKIEMSHVISNLFTAIF